MRQPKRFSGLSIPPAARWLPLNPKQVPPGGWRIMLPIDGNRVSCAGTNPEQVLDAACRALMDSNRFVSLQDTIDQVIAVYAARPGLTLGKVPELVVSDMYRPEPSNYGNHLWAAIHLSCSLDQFDREFFTQVVEMAWVMINDPHIGCEDCAGHFKEYLASHPISDITAAGDAQRWGYDFHSAVSARLGKPSLTFQRAALQWGWKLDEEI